MKHLYSNQSHDECEVWCGKDMYYRDGEPTNKPGATTCEACLRAAADFGSECARRRAELRYAASRGVTL